MTTHLLNFEPQFSGLVHLGAKRQTIRPARKRPFAVGDTLRLYTGLRRPGVRLLGEGRVTAIRTVRFAWDGWLLDGKPLAFGALTRIAHLDGFGDWFAMIHWFEHTHGLPFEGVLIRWVRV